MVGVSRPGATAWGSRRAPRGRHHGAAAVPDGAADPPGAARGVQCAVGPDPEAEGGANGKGALPDKTRAGVQSLSKRATGRFFAMDHHIFGLQVAPVEVDVGALSPDVTVSKMHSVAVLGVVLNHGVLHWKNLVSMPSFLLKSPQSAPLGAWRKRTRFWSASKATPVLAARLLFSLAAQCTGGGKTP